MSTASLVVANDNTLSIGDAISGLLSSMRQHVLKLYEREVKEWTPAQVESKTYAMAIAAIERDQQFKTTMQYLLVAETAEKMLYVADGDDDIKTWLARFPDIPNPRSGRMSQVVALATEIVPWCMKLGVTVGENGIPVDHSFVGSNLNGIAVSNRARQFIGAFRSILEDGELSPDFKRDALSQLWGVIANPENSVREIRNILDGEPQDGVEILTVVGVPDLNELPDDELRWVLRVLKKRGISLVEVGKPILIDEHGSVTLNAEAFVAPLVTQKQKVKIYF